MDNPSPIMTIDEIAEYLQLHPLTVRRLARKREIPVFKLGRQWRAKRELFDQWLEQRSVENIKVSPEQSPPGGPGSSCCLKRSARLG